MRVNNMWTELSRVDCVSRNNFRRYEINLRSPRGEEDATNILSPEFICREVGVSNSYV